jgi:hypothetical protein
VSVSIVGTGVLLRLAGDGSSDAVLDAEEELQWTSDVSPGEVSVVAQAFVEFEDHGELTRWFSQPHRGEPVPRNEDSTLILLRHASIAEDDIVPDLLSDLRISGKDVSRWQLLSAPRRIELDPKLEALLAPRRRG